MIGLMPLRVLKADRPTSAVAVEIARDLHNESKFMVEIRSVKRYIPTCSRSV